MSTNDLAYWQQKAETLSIENRLFIQGEYQSAIAGGWFPAISPFQNKQLANIAFGTAEDIDLAVNAARQSFERGDWSQATPQHRKEVLLRFAELLQQYHEELALLETLDTGKPITHSLRDDIPGAIKTLRWYAEAVDKIYGEIAPTEKEVLALIQREAVGVVGVIVPWNFPLLLTCWKIAPALAMGNSVVLKPSEKASLTALRLAGLAQQAGLPAGVFNVVPGLGNGAGSALARHADVDVLAFTGSTRVGKQLLIDSGQTNMKRVWLEAGGKSANIIFADCPDLIQAAQAAAIGIFYNQGQVCIAGSRILVEESIKEPFLQALRAVTSHFSPRHPLDPASNLGTLIDQAHYTKVWGDIQTAVEQGANLYLDGRGVNDERLRDTAIGPTIFTEVTPSMTIWHEEIFGPVLAVTTFTDEQHALALANQSDYGLGAAVWTSQLDKAHRMARSLKAGTVFVNNYNGGDMTVPFGGYKQSGNGRDKSLHALDKFSELKTVWIALQ